MLDETVDLVRVGVDTGGTFTDLVAVSPGGWSIVKVPSTPEDPSRAILGGIERLLTGYSSGDVGFLGHGTTVATNALLTRRGAHTVLLSTAGFEDVLELGRGVRADPYDFQVRPPQPLVRGRDRYGVAERILSDGAVQIPLLDAEVDRLIEIVRMGQYEAVAISLLWSFKNPAHEHRLQYALSCAFPDLFITCSSDVDAEIMEYERTSTTVVNAFVGPGVSSYLGRLAVSIKERGLPEPRIMQSNGGLCPVTQAAARPMTLLESGPAAGVVACERLCREQGIEDFFAIDMGGTSLDVALVTAGRASRQEGTSLQGMPVRTPLLDIRSIGAGGGSVAWVDEDSQIRVGPQSAGAVPGPACYGHGGTAPTVSDANCLLGFLGELADEAISLDRKAAEKAIRGKIAEPLGMSVVNAAAGVFRIVTARMSDAMRLIAHEQGVDPAALVLVAYGGQGPSHASSIARDLGISRTVIPRHPGAMSALGVATSDLIDDSSASVLCALESVREADLAAVFESLEEKALERLFAGEAHPDPGSVLFSRSLRARYIGHLHDIDVPWEASGADEDFRAVKAKAFHARYNDIYGLSVKSEPIMIMAASLRAVRPTAKPGLRMPDGDMKPLPVRMTEAWFSSDQASECPVYRRRADWQSYVPLAGPAIIQEYDSTTIVLPGQTWNVDEFGALVICDSQPSASYPGSAP